MMLKHASIKKLVRFKRGVSTLVLFAMYQAKALDKIARVYYKLLIQLKNSSATLL